MVVVRGWVWEQSLERALLAMSSYVGYAFDQSDWQAIVRAIPDTNSDAAGGWYSYPLAGDVELEVRMARAVGDGIVELWVGGDLDEVLAARIEVVLDLL